LAGDSLVDASSSTAAARAPGHDANVDGGVQENNAQDVAQPLRVESMSDGASSELHVLMRGKQPVTLPERVAREFGNAVSPVILHDSIIVYDGEDGIYSYHLGRGTREAILPIAAESDLLEYRWVAKDGQTLAVVHRREGANPTITILSIEPNGSAGVLLSVTPDPAPLIRCASRCYVATAEFKSPSEFAYLVSGGPEDPIDRDSTPIMKTISFEPSPRTSPSGGPRRP
jgi:hypothetical protein